ncbi:transmembrane anchor protein [uncultured Sneathiella sp.]|uniref:transmembrane anchor protein n=1 Tax=uncultured Sneathiella sp. TaxID=879315 RepID=UPI0030ED67DA
MHNSQKPDVNELPSSKQLLKSTIIAFLAAIVILVTVVLPAEYGIDPTRVGRLLGLAEMGEIKSQLAEEAEQDRSTNSGTDEQSSVFDSIFNLIIGTAHAQQAKDAWKDEITFSLEPGQGIEWKLVMEKGAVAEYQWTAENGRVNFDLHGDGGGQSINYEKGRGKTGAEGEIVAAFKGNHGWFWRNRDSQDVTIKLRLRGDYSELKQTY